MRARSLFRAADQGRPEQQRRGLREVKGVGGAVGGAVAWCGRLQALQNGRVGAEHSVVQSAECRAQRREAGEVGTRVKFGVGAGAASRLVSAPSTSYLLSSPT